MGSQHDNINEFVGWKYLFSVELFLFLWFFVLHEIQNSELLSQLHWLVWCKLCANVIALSRIAKTKRNFQANQSNWHRFLFLPFQTLSLKFISHFSVNSGADQIASRHRKLSLPSRRHWITQRGFLGFLIFSNYRIFSVLSLDRLTWIVRLNCLKNGIGILHVDPQINAEILWRSAKRWIQR